MEELFSSRCAQRFSTYKASGGFLVKQCWDRLIFRSGSPVQLESLLDSSSLPAEPTLLYCYADSLYLLSCADFIAKPSRRVVRSKVRRSQHFPRLDASNECQYVTRSVMRQISRNLGDFMSSSPCTSNYETGSYVVRVKVMKVSKRFKRGYKRP